MIVYRIAFRNYISELMIPQNANGTVIVFLPGLPTPLAKNPVSELLFNAGYTVFQPFFSGSFDSDGIYQPSQCVQDVTVFAEMAHQGTFKELYFSKQITYPINQCILLATSFGGSIATLAEEKNYNGIILLAPVLTYQPDIITAFGGDGELFNTEMKGLLQYLKGGFPFSYRINDWAEWQDFLTGKNSTLQPLDTLKKKQLSINILHGTNDPTVSYEVNKKIIGGLGKENLVFSPIEGATHKLGNFANEQLLHAIEVMVGNNIKNRHLI